MSNKIDATQQGGGGGGWGGWDTLIARCTNIDPTQQGGGVVGGVDGMLTFLAVSAQKRLIRCVTTWAWSNLKHSGTAWCMNSMILHSVPKIPAPLMTFWHFGTTWFYKDYSLLVRFLKLFHLLIIYALWEIHSFLVSSCPFCWFLTGFPLQEMLEKKSQEATAGRKKPS